jgi:hypothetical protein
MHAADRQFRAAVSGHGTTRLLPTLSQQIQSEQRCWGILENHWNGTLLDAVDTVLQFARTMTWQSKHPVVELVTTTYQTGVSLTKEAMETVEAHIKRLPDLGKWFVDIVPPWLAIRDT